MSANGEWILVQNQQLDPLGKGVSGSLPFRMDLFVHICFRSCSSLIP